MRRGISAIVVISGLLAGAGVASAAAVNEDATRLDWAKRQMETVCSMFDLRGEKRDATACYAQVARVLENRSIAVPSSDFRPGQAATVPDVSRKVRRAARPAPRQIDVLRSSTFAANTAGRCSSLLCSRYMLLGTGF